MDEQFIRIQAVMSMPRLCFSDMIFAALNAFLPLGIKMEKGTGIEWAKALEEMMRRYLDYDYIITLDYDSLFCKEHVIRLCQLMQEHPEADAIAATQQKRESDSILFLFPETEKENKESPIREALTAHFGLTVFRCESLRKLPSPWFPKYQNADSDIAFWIHFRQNGFRVFQAKDVCIGHLQLVCTFPTENGAEHHYLTNVLKKYPSEYLPKVEMMK